MLNWILRGLLKILLVVLLISAGLSFVTQLFSPASRQPASAKTQGSGLPPPLPRTTTSAKPNVAQQPSPALAQPVSAPVAGATPADPPSAPIDQTKPVLSVTHENIRFQLQSAVLRGTTLAVRITATNNDVDRMIEISSTPESKTLIFDESGNALVPNHVSIGNAGKHATKTRVILAAGVPTDIVLRFAGLPIVRGKPAIREIKLLRLDVALFSTAQAYSNSFSQPFAVCTPMLRNIEIKDDEVPRQASVREGQQWHSN